MLDDLCALKKIKDGDIKAFENIFRRYYTPLFLYAASIIRRTDVAEEIVQDLFYVLWKDRENINIIRSLKAYLYGAAYNNSLQYFERTKVRERYKENAILQYHDIDSLSPQEQMEYNELDKLINNILKKMPQRRFQIFQMHRFEGRKYAEIAEVLSVSVKTVEAEITKALKVLRKEIEIYTQQI